MGSQWYISRYAPPSGSDALLHFYRHDHAMALWRVDDDEIELARYWEFERYSGEKHHRRPLFDTARHEQFLERLLAPENLRLSSIEGLWDTPLRPELPAELRHHDLPVHTLSHLFSAVFMDTDAFWNAPTVAMAIDGGPDFGYESKRTTKNYAGATVRDGRISVEPVASPGILYQAAETVLSREPGTLMAMASFGEDIFGKSDHDALMSLDLSGSVNGISRTVAAIRSLLARAQLELAKEATPGKWTPSEMAGAAVMRLVQKVSEDVAVREVDRLVHSSGIDPANARLALAGGYALNCPTNSRLMDEFGFTSLAIPPCANDGGQALGVGLLHLYQRGWLNDRRFAFPGPYIGGDELHLAEALRTFQGWVRSTREYDASEFVSDVAKGPVAWVVGAAEVGPRALGHRSLLADPRRLKSKWVLNRIKRRRWWRPVAPAVLADKAPEWFEGARVSPYMLETYQATDRCRAQTPAVVHLDGSARIQTVARSSDPFARALQHFWSETGIPMLCNTSLNDKGEPIVQTATEAFNFCIRKGISVAYIDGTRIEFAAQQPQEAPPARRDGRSNEIFDDPQGLNSAWEHWLEKGVGPDEMCLLNQYPEMKEVLTDQGAESLSRHAEKWKSSDPDVADIVQEFDDWHGPSTTWDPRRRFGQ